MGDGGWGKSSCAGPGEGFLCLWIGGSASWGIFLALRAFDVDWVWWGIRSTGVVGDGWSGSGGANPCLCFHRICPLLVMSSQKLGAGW